MKVRNLLLCYQCSSGHRPPSAASPAPYCRTQPPPSYPSSDWWVGCYHSLCLCYAHLVPTHPAKFDKTTCWIWWLKIFTSIRMTITNKTELKKLLAVLKWATIIGEMNSNQIIQLLLLIMIKTIVIIHCFFQNMIQPSGSYILKQSLENEG